MHYGKDLSRESWSFGRGLKPTIPEYEVEVYPFLRAVYSKFYDHTYVTAGQSVTKSRRIAHIPGGADKSLA